jgi:pilus assembly protein FimV
MGKHFAPVKRLAPVVAVLAALAPGLGHALGLGNIVMNSALNQPLNAEVELLSVRKGDLTNLVVQLGSAEDFQRVGAERAFFLTKIKFDVVKRKDGTAYIQLSSAQMITEPFLDFVVEAQWSRGRILREFTVLVDPPVLSNEAPAPLQQASVTAPSMASTATESVNHQAVPIRARAELSAVSHAAGELVYGPVKHNDTLWVIANNMRPNGVTVNQMMAALVRANPNAFYNGNANQLKAGYVLRVDDTSVLDSLSVASADAEIERQRVEWRARKNGHLMAQTDAPVGGRVARAGDAATGARSTAEDARLKLVAPGNRGRGSGTGDANAQQMREDLLLAAEALDANRQETDELKTRLSAMEEQLAAMQRLIMLKDDEMLAMQTNMGAESSSLTAEEISVAEVTAPKTINDEVSEAAIDQAMDEAAKPEAAASAPAAPVVAPVVYEEPSLFDNPLLLYGGIGVLLLLVAAVVQRRRKMRDGFEESILNVDNEGSDAGATADSMGGGESSMVSDFAMSEMSGMSGIESDAADVDPISEADVYLAYGRHQQAEDILKEALEKEPERKEIKLKLLEVSFAAKNREAFELGAQEFYDVLGDETDPMWAKVVTMGTQLCPGSDLFGGSNADALKDDLEEMAEAGDDDLLDFDFEIDTSNVDLDVTANDLEANEVFAELEAATSGDLLETPTETIEMDSSLDFSDETAFPSDNSLDFDAEPVLESAVDELPDANKKAKTNDNNLDFDVSSLDFNLDVSAEDETAAVTDTGALDFDLDGLTDASEDINAALSMDDTAEIVFEENDTFVLDDSAEGLDNELDDALADDIFSEVDEVGTKLDLAKAYVDMGDADGARSILDEVMEEGTDDQKKQAEELLLQLA